MATSTQPMYPQGAAFGCSRMYSDQPRPAPKQRLTELFSRLTCQAVAQASEEPPEVSYSLSSVYDERNNIFVRKGSVVYRLNPGIVISSVNSTDTTRSTDTCTTISSRGDISISMDDVQLEKEDCPLQTIQRAMCFDEEDEMSMSEQTERITNLSSVSMDQMRENSLLSP